MRKNRKSNQNFLIENFPIIHCFSFKIPYQFTLFTSTIFSSLNKTRLLFIPSDSYIQLPLFPVFNVFYCIHSFFMAIKFTATPVRVNLLHVAATHAVISFFMIKTLKLHFAWFFAVHRHKIECVRRKCRTLLQLIFFYHVVFEIETFSHLRECYVHFWSGFFF